MRAILVASSALLLSGCGAQIIDDAMKDIPPPVAVYELSTSDRSVVEAGVRASLKDPMSAMFGPMTAAKRADGMISVCGTVNAKNSFGGYTGSKPFSGLMTLEPVYLFATTSFGGTDTATDVTNAFCVRMMAPPGSPIVKGVERATKPSR